MPKLTLLEIVTDILNDLDSDEVNSINDTIEAQQVAQIVKTAYYNIIDGRDWPHLNKLTQLNASGYTNKPTLMYIPEVVTKVHWIKYNKRKSTDTRDYFVDVTYMEPEDFIDHCNQRDSSAANVVTVSDGYSNVPLLCLNDTAPTYWTAFDDNSIYFDSYDATVDTTLQKAKTQVYGQYVPAFDVSDSFVPDLPAQAFSYLLSEAKSTAFISLKQVQNPKAEQHSISQKRRMSQDMWKTAGGVTIPNYGRRRHG